MKHVALLALTALLSLGAFKASAAEANSWDILTSNDVLKIVALNGDSARDLYNDMKSAPIKMDNGMSFKQSDDQKMECVSQGDNEYMCEFYIERATGHVLSLVKGHTQR